MLWGGPAFAGTASWYDSKSVKREGTCHAEKCYCADGSEIHSLEKKGELFAAMGKDIRLGSKVKITHVESGRSVVVTVRDRGGFGKKYGRSVDLCRAAFERLAPLKKGIIKVSIEMM